MYKIKITLFLIGLLTLTACASSSTKHDTVFLKNIPWGLSYDKTLAQTGPAFDAQMTPNKTGVAEFKRQASGVDSLVAYVFHEDRLQMIGCDFTDLSQYKGSPQEFAAILEKEITSIYGPSKHSMNRVIDPKTNGKTKNKQNVTANKPYNLYLKDWENDTTHVLLLVNQDSDTSTFGQKSERNFIWIEYRSKAIDPDGQIQKWRAAFEKNQ